MKQDKFNVEVEANYGRYLTHAGKLWSASYQLTATGLTMLLQTGVKPLHAVFRVALQNGGNLVITEGLTAGNAGTPLPFTNYNRVAKGETFGASLSFAPTGVTGGTALPPDYVPPVAQGNKQMSVMEDAVWVFAPNTKYQLVLTQATSGVIQFDIDAYEDA